MTTNLTDEVAAVEAKCRELEAKVEAERRRNDMQAGALRESRAQNEQLIKRNEHLAAQIARYDKHFRDALASSESIIKHRKELEPAPELPAMPVEPPPITLKGRLKRLAKNGGDAA